MAPFFFAGTQNHHPATAHVFLGPWWCKSWYLLVPLQWHAPGEKKMLLEATPPVMAPLLLEILLPLCMKLEETLWNLEYSQWYCHCVVTIIRMILCNMVQLNHLGNLHPFKTCQKGRQVEMRLMWEPLQLWEVQHVEAASWNPPWGNYPQTRNTSSLQAMFKHASWTEKAAPLPKK